MRPRQPSSDMVPSSRSVISRRALVGALAATSVVSHTGLLAAQVVDDRPPTVDTAAPQEVAPGVFVLRDHRIWLVPNVAIIIGRDAALVVDTGLGPANGERILAVARKLAAGRRLYLTTTHFHPEHTAGAQAFRSGATFICNAAQRDELAQKGERYIGIFRKTQSAAAKTALEGATLTLPERTYDGPQTSIDLGGRTVQLSAVGMAHTRGDQTVYLPDERILLTGDLIEERMFPIFPWFPPGDTDLDGARWVNVLRGFARQDPKLIVPGHGDPGGISIALNLAGQMEAAAQVVRDLRHAGRSEPELALAAKPVLAAAHSDWDHPGLLDLQIAYLAALPA